MSWRFPWSYRGTLMRCIATQCHRIATQSHPLSHDTNLSIMTLLPAARTTRRIAYCLAVSWLSSGLVVAYYAVSWRAPALPARCLPTLCHDTVHCIVTHTRRKWALAQPPCTRPFFFFSPFFFFLIPATGNTTKKNYFFFISSKPNKFIIIYFIYFFPVLHTVKP